MPSTRNSDQKLVYGTQSAAYMDASVDPIEDWAAVSDQDATTSWRGPSRVEGPERAEGFAGLDGKRALHGYWQGVWEWDYMTIGQVSYIIQTALNGEESPDCTIQDYDDENNAIYFNCIVHRPRLLDGTLTKMGTDRYRVRLVWEMGTEIT